MKVISYGLHILLCEWKEGKVGILSYMYVPIGRGTDHPLHLFEKGEPIFCWKCVSYSEHIRSLSGAHQIIKRSTSDH